MITHRYTRSTMTIMDDLIEDMLKVCRPMFIIVVTVSEAVKKCLLKWLHLPQRKDR